MLTVPDISPNSDVLVAALAYGKAGLYIGPLKQGSKNPGSVLLKSWPTQTVRSAGDIAEWFTNTSHGVFLHCGRSGLVVLDVDHPETVPAEWWPLLAAMPLQRSRPEGDPRRGHYIAQVPAGRRIGNAVGPTGRLGWGEVRGENGVIVLAPTIHAEAASGARYEWARTGPVPVLDALIADTLPEGGDRSSTVSDAAVVAWLEKHDAERKPWMGEYPVLHYVALVKGGASRHESAVSSAAWLCREIAAGLYSAAALDTLEAVFRDGFTAAERRNRRGSSREWWGILAWAVAQITPERVAEVRAKHGITDDPPPTDPDGGRDPLADVAEGTWAAWS